MTYLEDAWAAVTASRRGMRLRARTTLLLTLVLVGALVVQAAPAQAQATAADLSLAASATPERPHLNELTVFEFALTNNGPDASANAVVSGSVPPGVQMRSLSCGGGGTPRLSGSPTSEFECTYATIAAAETRIVAVRVDADVLGEMTVSAEVVADSADPDTSDNVASATADVRQADADLAVGLSAPSTATVGGVFDYRLSLFNAGPEDVKAASGTLVLPPQVSDPRSFSFLGGGASCTMPGATLCVMSPSSVRPSIKCWFPGDSGARSVTCEVRDGGLIGPGGSGGSGQFANMRVEALQVGTAIAEATTNTNAGISDLNATNDLATAETLIVEDGEVDLSIAKTAPAEGIVGQEFDYTLRVRNNGPITATAVTVTDALPLGVSLVSASGSGVTCTGTTTISCALGSLALGQVRTVTIRVRAEAQGSASNTASVSAVETDADPTNNSSTATVLTRMPATDLSVVASGPSEQQVARSFTLSLSVRNNGPDATSNVRVRGTLPDGIAMTSTGNFDCFPTAAGFECLVGSLIPNLTDFLQVRLESSATGAMQIPITVTQAQPDPDATNNEPVYAIDITPRPEANVGVTLSLPDTVEVGQVFSYDVIASNAGPDAARVTINSAFHEDAFSDEVASGPGESCSVIHGSATFAGETAAIAACSIDSLAPGDTWTVTVTMRAVEGGTQPVSGSASASLFDPVSQNNSTLGSIEVIDNQPPVVEAVAVPTSVDEGSQASASGTVADPDGDTVTVTASIGAVTDNGDGTWSWSYTPVDGPDGPHAVTITAEDPDGEQDQTSFDLVVDDVAPTIALAGAASVVEAGTYTLTLSDIADPGDDTVTGWVVDWGDGTTEQFASGGDRTHVYADGPADLTIAVDLIDEDGTHEDSGTQAVAVVNSAPEVGAISAPVEPVLFGAEVGVAAPFSDAGPDDTHTATWDWGDGSTSPGDVDEADGLVGGSHAYAAPGVYTITLTVADSDGDAGLSLFEFVVVYDPAGGFVTGGGSIHSPEGAYTADPSLTGKATFGFVSKYRKGAATPSGNTQFQFKAASFNFRSSSYEWLVIAGATARYKGRGTVNGSGEYGFMLTATDGGASGEDRFRMKVWHLETGETVYDNEIGSPGDDVVRGSIVIHKG